MKKINIMKKLSTLLLLLIILLGGCANTTNPNIKEGDIILQTSKSNQSKAIQVITKSKYSHVGIVCKVNGVLSVLEAVQPVKITPLDEWINRGVNSNYTVMRYKGELTTSQKENMVSVGKKYMGLNYDLQFGWDDSKMYCSELVWKIFNNGAGIELCEVKTFNHFDLDGEITKNLIKKRFPNGFPKNTKVVAPSQLSESNLLTTIYSNY
jgi:uncharacterized protein YycO